MKKFLFLLCVIISQPAFAESDSGGTYSVQELLQRETNDTKCATAAFQNALADSAATVGDPKEADEPTINTWIHAAFANKNTLDAVLNCPELQNASDNDTIVFETVYYKFPTGREIRVNYETQKIVLKQKQLLANKPKLGPGDMNPDITADTQNGAIWVNVEPAWYAILIAEHGSLDNFVGPDKNNVVALKYIEDNIDTLYPKDHEDVLSADCTSRSAIAGDRDIINRAALRTFGGDPNANPPQTPEEKEAQKKVAENDFFVYGDVDLRWISALEIAADVVLTIVTWGGYGAASVGVKMARAARAFNKAKKAIETIKTSRSVGKFLKTSSKVDDVAKAIKNIDKIDDSVGSIVRLEKNTATNIKNLENEISLLKTQKGNAKTIKSLEQELEFAQQEAKTLGEATKTANKLKETEQMLAKGEKALSPDEISKLEKEVAELKSTYGKQLENVKNIHTQQLTELGKLDDIKTYKELVEQKRMHAHTLYLMRQGKVALRTERGLLPVRLWKAGKALRSGLKSASGLNKSTRALRPHISGVSAKINDFLFHNTMRNINALAKVPAQATTVAVIGKTVAGLYDYTEVSATEYTNNIEFKPLLLLGADAIDGYDNEVNHGMWMLWEGSATTEADDDAAFLTAVYTAETLHQDLVEIQDELNTMACDVDIYVVRPIIRNPGTENEELYYLFMNETPWTTHGYNQPYDGTDTPLSTSSNNNSETIQTGKTEATSSNSPTINNTDIVFTGEVPHYDPPYDGTIIGGPCTPPSQNTGPSNYTKDILTTGRYANYPAFEKALITKFRIEGNISDDPDDAGGYTRYGVSAKYHPEAKNPNFSRADAEDIAFRDYYKKYNVDKLPDDISGEVFMAVWGMGAKRGIGLLQNILGVKNTGIVDAETINAAKNYKGNLRKEFLDERGKRFLKANTKIRKGLLRGLELYRANGCRTITPENVH